VSAGTIFEDSRLPLRVWFRAAWWMTNQKSGISALGLQRLLGLGSYRTAWMCLHKFRRAMIRPGREKLSGQVEVDETFFGGARKQKHFKRQKAVVGIAAEVRGKAIGRIRLKRIPNDTEQHIVNFVRGAVEPGAELLTDGAHAYKALVPFGYAHQRTVLQGLTPKEVSRALPRVHRIASLLKRWSLGAHQGRVSMRQLDHYLDEFAFRFNRRGSQHRGMLFYRLLQQSVVLHPEPYRKIAGHS
jgi:transposase-like protein